MAIKIINLRKEYKDVIAVNNINLEIKEGELFALLGVNGAGKTTLIKMLSTLTKPTSGDAFINGYSINKEEDKIKEIIDISMQETAIARKLTVDENIEFYARLNGQTKDEIIESKKYLYDVFNLDKVKEVANSVPKSSMIKRSQVKICSEEESCVLSSSEIVFPKISNNSCDVK